MRCGHAIEGGMNGQCRSQEGTEAETGKPGTVTEPTGSRTQQRPVCVLTLRALALESSRRSQATSETALSLSGAAGRDGEAAPAALSSKGSKGPGVV